MEKIHEATIRKIRVIYEEIKGPDTEIIFSKTSQSDNGFCPKKSYKVSKLYKVIFPVKIKPSNRFDLVPLELNSDEAILEKYEDDCNSCFLAFKKDVECSLAFKLVV